MKDANGRAVAIGDRVKLWQGQYGTVVCSIDTGEFTGEYPASDWSYLKSGVVVKSDNGEIFHYSQPDEDFELVKSRRRP